VLRITQPEKKNIKVINIRISLMTSNSSMSYQILLFCLVIFLLYFRYITNWENAFPLISHKLLWIHFEVNNKRKHDILLSTTNKTKVLIFNLKNNNTRILKCSYTVYFSQVLPIIFLYKIKKYYFLILFYKICYFNFENNLNLIQCQLCYSK